MRKEGIESSDNVKQDKSNAFFFLLVGIMYETAYWIATSPHPRPHAASAPAILTITGTTM